MICHPRKKPFPKKRGSLRVDRGGKADKRSATKTAEDKRRIILAEAEGSGGVTLAERRKE